MKWNNDYIVEKNDCFVEKYNYFPFGIVSNYSKVVYQENDYCSNVYPGQEEDDMFGYYNVTDFESILSQIDKHGYANLYFDESCFTHSSFPREVYYLIDSISDFLIHRDSRLAHKGIKIFMVPCNKLSLDDQNRILQMIKNYFDNKKSKKQFAEEQFDEDDEIKT